MSLSLCSPSISLEQYHQKSVVKSREFGKKQEGGITTEGVYRKGIQTFCTQ